MRSSETVAELAGALALANVELKNPLKDSKADAGKFSYAYAGLPGILDEVRPVLAANGISVLQETVTTDSGIGVTTRLLHVSGEWIELGPLLMVRSNSPQDNGSALTYARRYALCAALSIAADEDDDGALATKRGSSGTGAVTAAPSRQASRDTSAAQSPAADREATTSPALGEGADKPVVVSQNYLSTIDQGLLETEYGSRLNALKAYKARFGERITRLGDITYEMRDEMGAHV